METSVYGLRRKLATLTQNLNSTSDKIFAGERLDTSEIKAGTFQHCTFTNVSFLKAKIYHVTFIDCIFIGCYFRRTDIRGSCFTGCRFFHCDFSHITIQGSNLLYLKFIDCSIDYDVMKFNLPNEHNIREDLCRNLTVESAKLGHLAQARAFRLEEIRAREANLWAAVLWQTDWHRRHFYGVRRFRAGLDLVWSYVNRLAWGYGEKLYVLILTAAIFSLAILPCLLWLAASGLEVPSEQQMRWYDFIYLSLQTVMPANLGMDVRPQSFGARTVVVVGSVTGLIFAGLFVAYLLRWILRR